MAEPHLSNSELRHAAGLLHSVHADAANAVCRARTINEEKPDCSGSFEYRRRDSNPRHADYDRGNWAPNAARCVIFRGVACGRAGSDLPGRGRDRGRTSTMGNGIEPVTSPTGRRKGICAVVREGDAHDEASTHGLPTSFRRMRGGSRSWSTRTIQGRRDRAGRRSPARA